MPPLTDLPVISEQMYKPEGSAVYNRDEDDIRQRRQDDEDNEELQDES
jgi:hypothetical protein